MRSRADRLASLPGFAALVALALLSACRRHAEPKGTPHRPAGNPLAGVRWDDTPLDWSRPLPTTPAGGIAEAGYVGSAACAGCHADLVARYARHSMARTGIRPLASLDPQWLAAIFDAGAAAPVQHPQSRYWYRPVRQGDRYFVEEALLGADGQRVQTWLMPIDSAISAGSYGMAFFFQRGTRLYQVPLDYYAGIKRWDIDPGATGGDFRFGNALGVFCISCHSDYPRRAAGSRYRFFAPMPTGVGCERCHGPGARHAETARREDIVNPARLPPPRQLDVCAQCHESSHAVLRADRHDFSYRPGTPLDEFRVNHLAVPAEPDRFALLAHAERMIASACWRGSAGKLTCTSCHDAHVSSAEEPPSYWDGKCQGCHQDHPCTESKAVRAKVDDHCVVCHMRKGAPATAPLVTVTDHWIQRRPPPIRPGSAPRPERLATWSEAIGEPVHGADSPALAAVASAEAGRDDDALELALGVLAASPHVPKLYAWAASRLPGPLAWRAQQAVLRFDPDSGAALMGYARGMLDVGSPAALAEAGHAIDRALALDPDDPDFLELQGMILMRQGKPDDAKPWFERAVAAGPMTAAAEVGLGALARAAGRLDDAAAHLEAARRIEPRDPWVLGKLAELYGRLGDRLHGAEVAHARAELFPAGQAAAPTDATRWLPPAFR